MIIRWIFLIPLLCACSSLLYQPTRSLHFDPAQFGVKPEEVKFKSEDGTELFAWYFRSAKKPKALLVFFHGNGGNLSSHYPSLLWSLKEGYDFFIFDYRGYGRSENKQATPENTLQDGRAAIRWAYKNHPELPLLVFAQSLGGAVAMRSIIDLKGSVPIRILIVDSSFASYRRVARKVLAHHTITWPFQWLSYLVLSDEFAPGKRIAEIAPIPMIVMHGDADQVVDFSLGEEVFAYAQEPKVFWRIPGGDHIDSMWKYQGKYQRDLLQKMDEILAHHQ